MKAEVAVIGSGPNGLAAAIAIAQAGIPVTVYEAEATAGGGARSAELTLPGFIHDVCSAVHPMGVASPFFRSLPLAGHGLDWIHPPAALAHPLDDGPVILVEGSVEETARSLDIDADNYRSLMKPFVDDWENLFAGIFAPLLSLRIPRSPLLLARFGRHALLSAESFARKQFRGERARALFLGVAAHANCPLDRAGTASIGLALLIAAHARGWPIVRGGTQKLTDALIRHLESLGGSLRLNQRITHLDEVRSHPAVLFDLMPESASRIAGERLPPSFRHGNGVFKMDWALSDPIPWRAQEIRRAGTVHIGASSRELIEGELAASQGRHAERPYVLLSQPSLFDPSRAPAGQHTAWAYCHVPRGSTQDMASAIEAQVERFAPGFRDCILKSTVTTPAEIERKNANMVGGDIGGGDFSLWRSLAPQGILKDPYALNEARGLFLCSSATPPGPGVHGMCGANAAALALRFLRNAGVPS